MFKGWKRFRLKQAYAKVQSYAKQKKVWGNNIATLIVMNDFVNDHYADLFDSGRFIDSKKNIEISSSFGNISDMLQWLNEVRLLYREAAKGINVELAGSNAHLNITKQHDVTLTDFLIKDGYPINLNDAYKNMSRIIKEIEDNIQGINSNQRQYFDLRLGTGVNTLLVFHELTLEVMMNE